jgi:insulysin
MEEALHDRTSRVEHDKRSFTVGVLKGTSVVYCMPSQSRADGDLNGATMNYYAIGYRDEKYTAITELMKTELRSRAYKYLRTEHQLGYVVQA